jgi:chromosome partitioning protein
LTRIIAVTNQKGGVGKTTVSVNLSAGLARHLPQARVLLVDADPQANATAVFLGIAFAAGPRQPQVNTIYELIVQQIPPVQAIQTIPLNNSTTRLDILPAHLDLASAELELVNIFERERRLHRALTPLVDQYDFIIIDCPPSLSLLTINALMAASEVLIPVDPGVFPIIGLNLLNRTIEMVRQANPALRIMGVIPALQDRTALARDTEDQLNEAFGPLLMPPIPRRVAIGEAHAAGMDIFAYQPGSDSAQAFQQLIEEVIQRG